jgi:hypothetical protein
MNTNELFEEGDDPFAEPAEESVVKRKRGHKPNGRFIGCPVEWFKWIVPLANSKERLALLLLLYRRCVVAGSPTISVPTKELEEFGLGRWSKYRNLYTFERLGILRVQEEQTGRPMRVTMLHWPEPPPPDWTPPEHD